MSTSLPIDVQLAILKSIPGWKMPK